MTCNCCGATTKDFKYMDEFHHEKLLICANCRHIQIRTIPTKETIEKYYQNDYSQKRGNYLTKSYFKFMESRAQAQIDLIKRFVDIHNIRIYDIGCGFGTLIEALKLYTDDVTGFELDPVALEHCQEKGLHIEKADLEKDLSSILPAKLVTMSHFLEHIQNINEFMETLVNKADAFFIEVPAYNEKNKKQFTIDQEGHLNFFTQKSLELFLKRKGLQIKHIETYGPSIKHYYSDWKPFVLRMNKLARKMKARYKLPIPQKLLSTGLFESCHSVKNANGMWIRAIATKKH